MDLDNGHPRYIKVALKCFSKRGLTYILYFSKVLKIQSCDDFEYLSCIVCRISIPQRNSYFNKPLKIIQMDSFPREYSSCFCKEVFLLNHSGESLFPNICGLPLLLFFWLKWAGYLAVAGLNLLAQISDRISHFGV